MEGSVGMRTVLAGNENAVSMATMASDKISVKRTSFGSATRKKLSDITNTQAVSGSPSTDANSKLAAYNAKFYIEQLLMEKAALLKLIEEKDKIIDLQKLHKQNFQIELQKLRQQNFQLAQANSHMLAELNLGKDRLKAMHHELGCTVALLKVKNLELEEERLKKSHQIGIKGSAVTSSFEIPEAAEHACDDKKPSNASKGGVRQSRVSSSRKSAPIQKRGAKELDTKNKRICLRRPSNTSKPGEPDPSGDLFEIEEAKFPFTKEACAVSLDSSAPCTTKAEPREVKEEKDGREGEISPLQSQAQGFRRSSVGRPLRRAAEKVCSYKERPLNSKMRRES